MTEKDRFSGDPKRSGVPKGPDKPENEGAPRQAPRPGRTDPAISQITFPQARPLPKENGAPSGKKAVPTDGKAVSTDGKAIPTDGKTVPTDGKAIPTDGKAIPTDGKTVPNDGKAVPTDGKTAAHRESLRDKIFHTPMLHVVAFSAVAAVAIVLFATLVLLICGFRYRSLSLADGTSVRWIGILSGDTPVFGRLATEKGDKAFVCGSHVKYAGGARYEGGFSGMLFNGEGVYTDKNGNIYRGTFYDGQLYGEVQIEYADGSLFLGSYYEGKKDGYGEYTGADGVSYKGYYAQGEKCGYGTFVYADGSSYEGYFDDDMRNGQGRYRFASGDTYTGEFRNNFMHGTGTYFFAATGRVFSGRFVNGVPQIQS